MGGGDPRKGHERLRTHQICLTRENSHTVIASAPGSTRGRVAISLGLMTISPPNSPSPTRFDRYPPSLRDSSGAMSCSVFAAGAER